MAAATKTGPKSVADVIANAKKKFDLHLGPLSDVAEDVSAVSTGNIAIDHILGVGGLALGRSVELYGLPSSGKTTTALQSAAVLQQLIIAGGDSTRGIGPDDVIAYFDYEHALDLDYARALGLNVDHASFLFTQPDSLEQGANVALELLETGACRMLVWDSVAAMNPQAAMEAEVGAQLPAIQARVMADFLKKLNSALHEHNCVSVFVNHLKDKMVMGASRPGMPTPTTTPGGVALKFYASVRAEFTHIKSIKGMIHDSLSNEDIEMIVASEVRVKVTKNKLGPPFKQAIVRVRFGRGFDNFWTSLQILIAHKRVVYSSGYFYFEKSPELAHVDMNRQTTGNKRPYVQGEQNIFDFADEHSDWRAQVITSATAVIGESEDALAAITEVGEAEVDLEAEVEPMAALADLPTLLAQQQEAPTPAARRVSFDQPEPVEV